MAAWAGVAAVFRKHIGGKKAVVQIVEVESTPAGVRAEWWKVEGDGRTIEAALIQRARAKHPVKAAPKKKARPKKK
jgi:hypothetical protein